MQKIVIIGASGTCRDILDTVREINARLPIPAYECVGFLDDDPSLQGRNVLGVNVLGPVDKAESLPSDCRFVNGIGSPSSFLAREGIISRTRLSDERYETIVHPSAEVSHTARLGRGTVLLQHVTVASSATLGRHVTVLANTVISHDDIVEDYVCIAGGAYISGGVTLGKSSYLGANCTIIENAKIGDHSLVGMGSVVRKDVPSNRVVVGNPARVLRTAR